MVSSAISKKYMDMANLHVNESIMEHAKHLALYKVGSGLQTYYLPVICTIGFIGNTISLIVLLQPHNKRLSCCLYLAGLAVNDNFIIYIDIRYWCIMSLHIGNLTNFHCRWIAYAFHVSIFLRNISSSKRQIPLSKRDNNKIDFMTMNEWSEIYCKQKTFSPTKQLIIPIYIANQMCHKFNIV